MKRINKLAATIGAFFVFVMVILISANIIGRKIGAPLPGAINLAGVMLAVVTFLGLSHCEEVGGHVRVETLFYYLPSKGKKFLLIFDALVALCMYAIVVGGTSVDALHAWQVNEVIVGEVETPMYPSKTIVAIGGLLMFIQLLITIKNIVTEPQEERESEETTKKDPAI
jgi:TRAP-type C4-dicarboxylate transport system permease small subunit